MSIWGGRYQWLFLSRWLALERSCLGHDFHTLCFYFKLFTWSTLRRRYIFSGSLMDGILLASGSVYSQLVASRPSWFFLGKESVFETPSIQFLLIWTNHLLDIWGSIVEKWLWHSERSDSWLRLQFIMWIQQKCRTVLVLDYVKP